MGQEGQSVFTSRHTEMCPSCLDREAVNLLGKARFRNGTPLTFGCEECGGTGRVSLLDHLRADPYSRKK